MAASPRWKVFNPRKEYVASCKHVEDAAALGALYGDGASIADGHNKRTAKLLHDACEQDRIDAADRARKLAAHDDLLAAAKDALYCLGETWPGHVNLECDFDASEELCSPECRNCGCIWLKANNLRAAIAKATQ